MKMVDQNDKVSEERALSDGTQIKICVDCGTSKTPLWRGGPAGPKSLCNACGIRSRKKRRALLGLIKEEKKAKKSTGLSSKCYSNNCNSTHVMHDNNSTSSYNNSSGSDENCSSSSKLGDFSLKKKLLAFGGDFALQRPRSSTNQRRKLGEVEQAAFLLMALSCGSVYA